MSGSICFTICQPHVFLVVFQPVYCVVVASNETKERAPTRSFFNDDTECYIMDAKSMGNLGRYLNVSFSFLSQLVCMPDCNLQDFSILTG